MSASCAVTQASEELGPESRVSSPPIPCETPILLLFACSTGKVLLPVFACL